MANGHGFRIFGILDADLKRRAFLVLGLMLVGMVFETLGVGLIVPAIALMVQSDIGAKFPQLQPWLARFGPLSQAEMVTGAMAILAAVFFIKNIFLAYLAWQQGRFVFNVQTRLSEKLFALYLQLPYSFHLEHNSARLSQHVAGEASNFANQVLVPGMALLAEGFVLLGIGALLLTIEPLGALTVATLVGFCAWLFHRITCIRMTYFGRIRQMHEQQRAQQLQQALAGIKDVKMFNRETFFFARFAHHNQESARAAGHHFILQQMPRLWLELLAVLGLVALVFSMVGEQRPATDIVPVLGLFSGAAFRLMPSMNRIIVALHALRYGRPVVDLLVHELSRLGEVLEEENDQTNIGFVHEIRFSNVHYRYPGATKNAINGISLVIHKGETVGIVGSSGSGKSTLVDVMLGLLAPQAGQVNVDGVDIRKNLRGWRRQVGYVPQTIYLTDDTLRRNIAFGIPDEEINEAAVQRALAFAQLEGFVATLPKGLDTLVGERGVRLSGGQRQRIGIARALYHNPDILVLDEATSALDNATEHEVMQAITALQGQKTILIVAHRLSTVERCDKIFWIEQGQVVQEGTPAEVLKRLAAHQTGTSKNPSPHL